MSVFWLRLACVLYGVGLAETLVRILRRKTSFFPLALKCFAAGALLHFVALVEFSVAQQHLAANNFFETSSLCAFLFAVVYLAVNARYPFSSLSIFVFPVVFVLTMTGAMGHPVETFSDGRLRGTWLGTHIVLVLIGYAGLLVSASGALLYLLSERRLKRKGPRETKGWTSLVMPGELPPLDTLDRLITRSMSIGFVSITLAVVAGSTYAFIQAGTRWIAEPKIAVSFVTWGFYLLMVFLRVSAGWRGRKAAMLALLVLGFGALTWAAHVGLRPLLER
jgi:ABC-type uncharacterized transport system permease subunit